MGKKNRNKKKGRKSAGAVAAAAPPQDDAQAQPADAAAVDANSNADANAAPKSVEEEEQGKGSQRPAAMTTGAAEELAAEALKYLEGYFGNVSDEPLHPDPSYPPLNESLETSVIIAGLPKIGSFKVEKLKKVVTKLVSRFGTLAAKSENGFTGVHLPVSAEGTTLGVAWVEYATPEEARQAIEVLADYKFDKDHSLSVVPVPKKDSDDAKRYKTAIGSVAEEFACPITTELPVDPVTAEDGRIYERSAIEKHIQLRRNDLKSPATNEPMGPKLFPAVQVRNSIKMLVESGTIEGTLATTWKEQIKIDNEVRKTRKQAEEGGTDAMCDLGDWCFYGNNGLPEDVEQAYAWYKKAADLDSVRGMAMEGSLLFDGDGVEENKTYGMHLMTMAAALGSDLAAYDMGCWHMGKGKKKKKKKKNKDNDDDDDDSKKKKKKNKKDNDDDDDDSKDGVEGFPQDKAKAMHWFRKVVDGDCSTKHLSKNDLENAQSFLTELQEEEE